MSRWYRRFRLYNSYDKEVQNYEESYRQAKIKYDAGALPSLSFVIYNTNKNLAELNLINAKYSYLLATKDPGLLSGAVDLVNPSPPPTSPRAQRLSHSPSRVAIFSPSTMNPSCPYAESISTNSASGKCAAIKSCSSTGQRISLVTPMSNVF